MCENKLTRRGNVWNWTQFHKWKEKENSKIPRIPLIKKDTKIFTIGSCFAQNLAKYFEAKNQHVHHFPQTIHFFTLSILQELKHLLIEPQYTMDDLWITEDKQYANPFRKPSFRTKTMEEMGKYSKAIEDQARSYLLEADVIIITLGGTEIWRNPNTKKPYLTIPYPEIFNDQMPELAEFHNLTFQENYAALEEIYFLLRKYVPQADIIMTVSPNRLTFTVSKKDIVLANCQGKSVLRAALGELTDKYQKNLYYFHSYELIEYSDHPIDFFDDEQRHVNTFAVTMIMNEFMKRFAVDELFDKSEYSLINQMVKERTGQSHVRSISLKRRILEITVKWLQVLGLYGIALNVYNRMISSKRI